MSNVPDWRRDMLHWTLENTEVPDGAIIANLDAQTENNSYGVRAFYVDQPYNCRDCGAKCVWTAREQQRYIEVQKRNFYARRVRCTDCHRKDLAAKAAQKQHMTDLSRPGGGT